MEKVISWNCNHGKPPSKSLYVGLILFACKEDKKEGEVVRLLAPDGEKPEFYTLYGVMLSGLTYALHDFDNESAQEALCISQRAASELGFSLENALPNSQGGALCVE